MSTSPGILQVQQAYLKREPARARSLIGTREAR